jgi:hypothetical protein
VLRVRDFIIITNERDSFWAFTWIPDPVKPVRNDKFGRSDLFFVTVSNNRQKCRDSKF